MKKIFHITCWFLCTCVQDVIETVLLLHRHFPYPLSTILIVLKTCWVAITHNSGDIVLACWQKWVKGYFRHWPLHVISCGCLSSGGVFTLRPWAQDGDGETTSFWERGGWYWHRRNLRDFEELFIFDFLVLWLWIVMSSTKQLAFSLLVLTHPCPHPQSSALWHELT